MFNEASGAPAGDHFDHADLLGVLARSRPAHLKAIAETLLQDLADIRVIANRTGLVMVPMRDTVENTDFFLGEVLVSEAHIADAAGHVGYGMITGRDLETAMAMAVADLALGAGIARDKVLAFIESERRIQSAADETRLRQVEATRVEMETF